MSGISVGWYTGGFPDNLGMQIRAMFRKMGRSPHALRRREIRANSMNVGVAYGLLSREMGLHVEPDTGQISNECFFFVLDAVNRPCFITAARSDLVDPIITGYAPPTEMKNFMLGAFEVKPGQTIHFDETRQWKGLTNMPDPDGTRLEDPTAAVIIVRGFQADQLTEALGQAMAWVASDIAASSL